jgi:hypothetical protein
VHAVLAGWDPGRAVAVPALPRDGFDAAYTEPPQGTGEGLTPRERVTVQMTFSDFGTPVSASPPPASEVFIPNI